MKNLKFKIAGAIFSFLTVSALYGQPSVTTHMVQRGETFASIAAKYNITEHDLRTANPNAKTCFVGMKLSIKQNDTSAKKVQSLPQPSYKENVPNSPHFFEGELLYRSYEHHSTLSLNFSGGQAYNGERITRVLLNKTNAHIIDESLHMHTIVLLNENKVYVYSDVSKEGMVADADILLPKFFDVLNPNSDINNFCKTSTLAITGKEDLFKGEKCHIYAGQLMNGKTSMTDVEMWYYDKLLVNNSYCYMFSGLPVPGIVCRGIYSSTATTPLGKLKTTQATELIELKECEVDDSDMLPPSDINIKPMTSDTQLNKVHKMGVKQLKKQKMFPKIMSAKEVDKYICSLWDFADGWLTKEYNSQKNEDNRSNVGESLFNNVEAGIAVGDVYNSQHNSGSSSQILLSSTSFNDEANVSLQNDLVFTQDFSNGNSKETPDQQRRRQLLKERYDRVWKAMQQNRNRKAIYNSSIRIKKTNSQKIERLDRDYVKLKREQAQIVSDIQALNDEVDSGERATAEERAVAKRRIDAEYNDNMEKVEQENKSIFKMGEGDMLISSYSNYRNKVISLRNNAVEYRSYTLIERRKLLDESQNKMKELRAKYKKGAGNDMPGASNSLENWDPTDSELLGIR